MRIAGPRISDLVNQIRLFADDTSLFVVVDNDIINSAKSLTSDLERIISWSEQWAVNFNANKTVNVDFTRKTISHPLIQFGSQGEQIKKM